MFMVTELHKWRIGAAIHSSYCSGGRVPRRLLALFDIVVLVEFRVSFLD